MSKSEDTIFPLVDRPTPVLDRFRENRPSRGESYGKEFGKIIKEEDTERKENMAIDLMEGFRRGIAEELGVPQESIEGEFAMEVAGVALQAEREDILVDNTPEEIRAVEETLDEDEEETEDEEEQSSRD